MSYKQTVSNFSKTGKAWYTIEPRPICPLPQSKWTDLYFEMEVEKGTMRWDVSGLISETTDVYRYWLPKPTIKDAVMNPFGSTRAFMQFHKDGSVDARIHGADYYWGA